MFAVVSQQGGPTTHLQGLWRATRRNALRNLHSHPMGPLLPQEGRPGQEHWVRTACPLAHGPVVPVWHNHWCPLRRHEGSAGEQRLAPGAPDVQESDIRSWPAVGVHPVPVLVEAWDQACVWVHYPGLDSAHLLPLLGQPVL